MELQGHHTRFEREILLQTDNTGSKNTDMVFPVTLCSALVNTVQVLHRCSETLTEASLTSAGVSISRQDVSVSRTGALVAAVHVDTLEGAEVPDALGALVNI